MTQEEYEASFNKDWFILKSLVGGIFNIHDCDEGKGQSGRLELIGMNVKK